MARDTADMDWNGVLDASPRDVESNEVEADKLYKFLSNAVGLPEVEPDNLQKILEVAIAVMKFKGEQASAYFDELVQEGPAGGGANEGGDVSGRVAQLEDVIRQRDKTIRELQASSSGHLQTEVRRLREEGGDLRREVDRLKREGERDRDEIHHLLGDLDNLRGKMRDAETQRDELLQDVNDYKSQVQWQAKSLSASQQGGAGAGHYKDLLRNKDRKLNETLDEVEKLTTANDCLEGEITGLTSKLSQVEKGRLELLEQMRSLREAVRDSDMKKGDAESKNKIMKGQIEDLSVQVQQARKSDEDVMTIINTKAVEWEGLLQKKEEELRESRRRVGELEQKLRAASGSSDKRTVDRLTKELQTKEEEVRVLRHELSDAAHHLEELTDQLQQTQHLGGGVGGAGRSGELSARVTQLERALDVEREQRRQSDVEKVALEEELAFVSRRLKEYETGEYGLGEAVAEIKRRKEDTALRDRQISKLTEEVNRLSAEVDTAYEENEVLRGRLGLSAREEVDLSQLRHRKNVEIEQLRAVNRELDKQVQRLEEERVDLRQQLLVTAKKRAQRAVELGLTTDSLVSVEEYAEQLRVGNKPAHSPSNSVHSSPHRGSGAVWVKEEREEEVSRLKRDLGSARKALERSRQDKKALESELQTCKDSLSGSITKMKSLEAKASSLKQENARLKQQLKAAKRHAQAVQGGVESVDGQPTLSQASADSPYQQEGLAAKALENARSQWKSDLQRLIATVSNEGGGEERVTQVTTVTPTFPNDRDLLSQLGDSLSQLREKESAERRKVEVLQGENSSLQQRLTCLQVGPSPPGTSSSEEEGRAYLQRWKVETETKLDQLQAEVERRVPREELDVLEEQYRDLSAKYQELVQRQCLLVGRAEVAEKAASQEIAPMLERSKAIEEQCCELTAKILAMQHAEGQLRRELAEGIPRETYEANLRQWQGEKDNLTAEVLKLKEAEGIVQQQCLAMATISQSYEQEISLLKRQLLELQSQTDDRVIIAKLTQRVAALETSEASALQQLGSAQTRLASRESSLLKAKREVDKGRREMSSLREGHHRQLEQEQGRVRSLQRRYAGVMTLTDLYHVGIQASTSQRTSQQEPQLTVDSAPLPQQTPRGTPQTVAVQLGQYGGHGPSGHVEGGVKTSEVGMERMQTELTRALMHAEQLELALQETKGLLVKREREMAELRVLLSQQRSNPFPQHNPSSQPSTTPPSIGATFTITQAQLTAKREQDLQAQLMAQQTIVDLKDIISQKESMVNKYQSLLRQARRETQTLTDTHAAEMAQLTEKLHREQEVAFERFKQTSLDTLHHLPSSETPQDQLRSRVKDLEETLAHREREQAVLEERLRGSMEEQQRASQQYQGHIERLREEMSHLEQESQFRAKQFENAIADKSRKILNLETEIEVMEGELRAAREAAHKSAARTTRDLVEKLKGDMATKEKQYKALSAALVEVRAELIEVTQRTVEEKGGRKNQREEEEEGLRKVLEEKTEELQGQVSRLSAQLSSFHEEAAQEREAHQKNLSLIDELQEKLLERDSLVSSLRSEVQSRNKILEQVKERERKAEEERERLHRRLEANAEVEELQKRIKVLQVRMERERHRAGELETALKASHESASSTSSPPSSSKGHSTVNNKHSTEEVIRWEESKKWQKKLATLRAKVTEKSREVDDMHKQNKSLKDTIERSERERSMLQVKLKSAQRALSESLNSPCPKPQGQENGAPKGVEVGKVPTLATLDEHEVVHKLKSRVYELENEVSSLQLRLSGAQQAEKSERRAAHAQLQSTLSEVRAQVKEGDAGALVGRVGELQEQLLQCQKENMELRFELEQAVTSTPRMKARITDLEEFVTVLRKTVSEAERKAAALPAAPSGERQGSTSKSVLELERVINAMKKVIEKLRSENADLKQQATLKAAPSKSTVRDSSAKMKEMDTLVARAAAENEGLLMELKQERERVCNLQAKVSSLEAAERKRKERERDAGKESSAREERTKKLQDELDKKNEMLKEIKIHLQDAAKREERLTLLEGSQEKLAALVKEREQLRQENEQLHKELDNFDPSFFEEIEDLKYNYHESQQTIARYEEQLQQLCKQFGVPLPDV